MAEITNPQVVKTINEVVRPMADRLAGMLTQADAFYGAILSPTGWTEVLGPCGITPELVGADLMPSLEDFPDEVIGDGAVSDGRPIATLRKFLALVRIVAQLKGLADMEQNGISEYTRSVAFSLAVNPR
jgi:hypothetical protein